MGCCSMELSFANLVLLGALVFTLKKLFNLFNQWRVEKMLERWDTKSKGKLVLHTMQRGRTLPSVSPFGLKLETYLKMMKLPHEVDLIDAYGPKGKLPWISDNGKHVTDSHFIIEYLRKKHNLDINAKFTKEQLGVSRAVRIMLEDRFGFGFQWHRLFQTTSAQMIELIKLPQIFMLLLPLIKPQVMGKLKQIGIGNHTPEEIYQLTEDDIRSVSLILGNKKYIIGDEPCEDDCAIFGMLGQVVFGAPGSSYERLVNGECRNIKEYCERIKENVWPDWDSYLDRS